MLHIWYKNKLYFAFGLNIDFIYYFIQDRTNFRSLLTYGCSLNQKWLIMGNFDVNKSWDDYLKRMRNVLSSPDRYYRLLQNLDLLIVLKRISFIIIQRQSVNIKDERNQQCLYCKIYTYLFCWWHNKEFCPSLYIYNRITSFISMSIDM